MTRRGCRHLAASTVPPNSTTRLLKTATAKRPDWHLPDGRNWVLTPASMLTLRQIDLIQDSFAKVLPIIPLAAATFYDRLFVIAPDTRRLFHGNMTDQGRKLFLTLATVVDSLDRLDEILPVAEALAIRHVAYGARDEHYAAVGTALVDALTTILGDDLGADTAAAWNSAYAVLSGCMLAAAHRPATKGINAGTSIAA